MDDHAKLLGDDLDRADVEIIGPKRFYIAGAVVPLAAVRVGKDGVSGGDLAEGFDGPSAVGVRGLGLAPVRALNLSLRRGAPDPQDLIQVPHSLAPLLLTSRPLGPYWPATPLESEKRSCAIFAHIFSLSSLTGRRPSLVIGHHLVLGPCIGHEAFTAQRRVHPGVVAIEIVEGRDRAVIVHP